MTEYKSSGTMTVREMSDRMNILIRHGKGDHDLMFESVDDDVSSVENVGPDVNGDYEDPTIIIHGD